MKCELCEGKTVFSSAGGTMWLQELPNLYPVPRLHVTIRDEFAVFRIKYCPMCGRKLDEE